MKRVRFLRRISFPVDSHSARLDVDEFIAISELPISPIKNVSKHRLRHGTRFYCCACGSPFALFVHHGPNGRIRLFTEFPKSPRQRRTPFQFLPAQRDHPYIFQSRMNRAVISFKVSTLARPHLLPVIRIEKTS